MITGQNIVCVGLPTWDGDYMKTIVQIMSRLSRYNQVLYVDYPYTWKDVVMTVVGKQKAPIKRMLDVSFRLRKITTEYNSMLYVLTPPPVYPINWLGSKGLYKFGMRINGRKVKKELNKTLQLLQMDNPIMINAFNPFIGLPMLGSFEERLNLYYCYDEIKAARWAGKHGGWVETAFIQNVDGIVTTSDALKMSKEALAKRSFVVKNGVDTDLFQARPNAASSKEKDRKTIGYIGSVDERFDVDTMIYAAVSNPQLDFEIIGRVVHPNAQQRLATYANVHFHPPRPAKEIPEAVAKMDVCLIPYIRNELTEGVYPLKINEYLAMGKPVVMTTFADLPEFDAVVHKATTREQFEQAIHTALDSDHESLKRQRIAFAKENSWDARVEELSAVIEQLLKQPKA